MPDTADRVIYGIEEVAYMLGISVSTVRKRMADGSIPTLKLGPTRIIPRPAFDAWLKGSANKGVTE